jgi:hypothetical protein
MRRYLRKPLGFLAVALLLVGCSQSSPSAQGPGAVSDCKRDFESAAAVDDMHDTNSDLNPTFFSCSSVKEWLITARGTSGLSIVKSPTYIRNRCFFTIKQVTRSPVCRDLRNHYMGKL